MSLWRLTTRLATLVLATGMVAAGCAPGAATKTESSGASVEPLGAITVRLSSDWDHMDPSNPTGSYGGLQGKSIETYLYDSLLWLAPDASGKLTLLPYVATQWKATPSEINFTLRKDVTCADGTPLTATAIKNSYERHSKFPLNTAYYGSKGPFTFIADDAAGTLTLKLQNPASDAIYAFTLPSIICPAGLVDPTKLTNTPAGSGPYTLESAVHGDAIVLKRRAEWKWGPNGITSAQLPEKVTLKIVPNDTTAANLMLTGGLDVAQISGQDVPRLLAEKALLNKSSTGPLSISLRFFEGEGRPTADRVVREALASAIDTNAVNQAANQGRGQVSPSILLPSADCYDASTGDLLPKNPSSDKARSILEAGGWTRGADGKLSKGGQPLRVILGGYDATRVATEYLASVWEKAGVTVDMKLTDFNTWRTATQTKLEYDTYISPVASEHFPNRAVNNIAGPFPPAGLNVSKVVNQEAEAAITKANGSVGDERCRQWSVAIKAFMSRFDVFPMPTPFVYTFTKGIDLNASHFDLDPRFFRRAK